MADKRKSPANDDALARDIQNDSGKESFLNDTMNVPVNQNNSGIVSSLLLQGKDNAIPASTLMDLLGVKKRVLYSLIERERSDGAVILSRPDNGGGFFLPSDGEKGRAEIVDWLRTAETRAATSFKTCRSAREAIKKLDGQQTLEGME